MFFRHLHAVARHTPLHIIVAPAGEQLRLIVTPKPSGDAADNPALAKPFSATGTPEELDAELPEVLRKYAESVNDLRTRLDLPLDALEAEKAKVAKKDAKKTEKAEREAAEKKRREEAAKKAAETRAANAKAKLEEKARKERERKEKLEAKKRAKAGSGITPPTTPAPATPEAGPEPKHRANLPGKEDCLRDYQNLARVHGDKLTRRLFIKKATTARRYEKLWKNWEEFVAEAKSQGELPLEQNKGPAANATQQQGSAGEGTAVAAADAGVNEGSNPSGSPKRVIPVRAADAGGGSEEGASSEEAARETGAAKCDGCKHLHYSAPGGQLPLKPFPHSRCSKLDVDVPMITGEQGKWLSSLIPPGCPFHEAARPVKGMSPGPFTDVYDEAGTYLSSITTEPEIGKHVHLGTRGRLRIVAIDARPSGGLDVTAVPDAADQDKKSEAAAGAGDPPPGSSTEEPAPAPASETRPEHRYSLIDSADGAVVRTSKYPFVVGEKLDLDVLGEERRYIVEELVTETTAAAREVLKHKKLVLDEAGNPLLSTDAIYEIADQVNEISDKEWRVVRIEETAYIARPAKPRLKGPLAAATTTE